LSLSLGPLAVFLALHIFVPVKALDFITALIIEVAFNVARVITSRPSAVHISRSVRGEAEDEARPTEALALSGPQSLGPASKPPACLASRAGVGLFQDHLYTCSAGFAATRFKGIKR